MGTAAATPSTAARPNDRSQPKACSATDSGVAAAIAPSWPMKPVIWVTKGACFTVNQNATNRITELKIIASPMPTSVRAASPAAYESAVANHAMPAVIRMAPTVSSRLAP